MDALNLITGLAILAGEAFALFLIILGAIDLWTHIKEKEGK
jgi:hypothetical protein